MNERSGCERVGGGSVRPVGGDGRRFEHGDDGVRHVADAAVHVAALPPVLRVVQHLRDTHSMASTKDLHSLLSTYKTFSTYKT